MHSHIFFSVRYRIEESLRLAINLSFNEINIFCTSSVVLNLVPTYFRTKLTAMVIPLCPVAVPAEGAFSNAQGSMLGGQRLDVYGPCYTANATIRASFGSETVTCTASSSDMASCTVPMVYFTGVTDVSIEVNGESFYSRYTYGMAL